MKRRIEDLPTLTLRALEPDDLDVFYEVENDRSLWTVGSSTMPYSREVLREFLLSCTNDIYVEKQLRLVIETPAKECAGFLDLARFEPRHRRAEVGIMLRKAFRHKGYAQGALIEIKTYAADILHLHQLYAVVPATNTSSCILFERVGFEQQGVLKDWLYNGRHYQHALLFQCMLR